MNINDFHYEIEQRTTNHPDTFEPTDVLYQTIESAQAEIERRKTWTPFIEGRIVNFKTREVVA